MIGSDQISEWFSPCWQGRFHAIGNTLPWKMIQNARLVDSCSLCTDEEHVTLRRTIKQSVQLAMSYTLYNLYSVGPIGPGPRNQCFR